MVPFSDVSYRCVSAESDFEPGFSKGTHPRNDAAHMGLYPVKSNCNSLASRDLQLDQGLSGPEERQSETTRTRELPCMFG